MSSEEDQPVKIEIPEPLPSPTPEQRALKRKRAIKQRLWIYGILFTVIYGGVWYQPYEVDWIPRRIPNPNPPVNPDTSRLFAKGTKVLVDCSHSLQSRAPTCTRLSVRTAIRATTSSSPMRPRIVWFEGKKLEMRPRRGTPNR